MAVKTTGNVRVAVVLSSSFSNFRLACMGAVDFAQTRPNWALRLVMVEHQHSSDIRQWRPHGILGVFSDDPALEWVREIGASLGVPVVTTIHEWPDSDLPQVLFDDQAIGAMAANHLLERGFRQLAYVGVGQTLFSRGREAGFVRAARQAGVAPRRYVKTSPGWRLPDDTGVRDWLRSLPKPVGMLADCDVHGVHAIEICHELGIRVPEEIAVIGVDNDDLRCCLGHPPLSSVMVPAREAGFEAARLLERLIRGKRAPAKDLRLPPPGIVMRASSNIVAYADPVLAAALRLMQDEARPDINVDDVVRQVGVGRRTLFRKFQATLGRTPFEEIHRLRLQRACNLLETTDWSLGEVAVRAGYHTPKCMRLAFRKQLGVLPDEYRHRHRENMRKFSNPAEGRHSGGLKLQ